MSLTLPILALSVLVAGPDTGQTFPAELAPQQLAQNLAGDQAGDPADSAASDPPPRPDAPATPSVPAAPMPDATVVPADPEDAAVTSPSDIPLAPRVAEPTDPPPLAADDGFADPPPPPPTPAELANGMYGHYPPVVASQCVPVYQRAVYCAPNSHHRHYGHRRCRGRR